MTEYEIFHEFTSIAEIIFIFLAGFVAGTMFSSMVIKDTGEGYDDCFEVYEDE